MGRDEGYIKFRSDWKKEEPLPITAISSLNGWRQQLYELKLIGVYPDGIGYGNVSCRWQGEEGLFIVSGSTTGRKRILAAADYTLVTEVTPAQNFLKCKGPIIASSESMSHAMIYEQCPEVNAAMHVHHLEMWDYYLDKVPATAEQIPYGTPEMAYAIRDLLKDDRNREMGFFVMKGHREGIFAFGKSLEETGHRLLQFYNKGFSN